MTAQEAMEALGLEPLEGEGGLYRQTYQSGETPRPMATAIYYMLTPDTFSHLHRLDADEMYHFYLGDAVELCELMPDGSSCVTELGPDLARGQQVQHLVKAGTWQGSRLKAGGAWALLGTTMSPGYEQSGYEHGDRALLSREYPARAVQIAALTNETAENQK